MTIFTMDLHEETFCLIAHLLSYRINMIYTMSAKNNPETQATLNTRHLTKTGITQSRDTGNIEHKALKEDRHSTIQRHRQH